MKPTKNEKGVALISVLAMLITGSALVAGAVATSQLGTYNISSHISIQRSRYIAEGAVARIQYLLAVDIKENGIRTLGEVEYENCDPMRYMADNVIHEIDYYSTPVRFAISDAVAGFELQSSAAGKLKEQMENLAETPGDWWETAVEEFFDCYTDYIDDNDELSTYGMESGEYEGENLAPLPRNGNMLYREEVWYLAWSKRLFVPDRNGRMSCMRLIFPGASSAVIDGAPSIFTADMMQLQLIGGLDKDKAKEIFDIILKWRFEKSPIAENIDSESLNTLKSSFSWQESGIYLINILNAAESGRPSARLSVTIETPPTSVSNDTRYHEFFYY